MAAIRFHPDFLLWGHREQDAPDNKNNMHDTDSKVRQESYLSIKYIKSPTGGVRSIKSFIFG
ncbi:MAG TPA: hypothetical protein PLH20_09425 [Flavobacterium sp.]|nr:hypothetical protein [Flavobacterium sp.]